MKKKRRATQNNNEQLQYNVYNFPSDFVAHIGMHIMCAHTRRDITMHNTTNSTIWNHNNLSEMSKRSTKMYLDHTFHGCLQFCILFVENHKWQCIVVSFCEMGITWWWWPLDKNSGFIVFQQNDNDIILSMWWLRFWSVQKEFIYTCPESLCHPK